MRIDGKIDGKTRPCCIWLRSSKRSDGFFSGDIEKRGEYFQRISDHQYETLSRVFRGETLSIQPGIM